MKVIIFGYTLCLAAEVAIAAYWIVAEPQSPPVALWASLSIPVVLALFIAIRHIRRRMTRMTVSADRLTYEAGLFSKTLHVVELVKVQDVRVDQSLTQRMFDIGDISIETAGGSSRIAMASIDNPGKVTEQILMMAQGAR
ncbi:MAG: PH domain-containing protein [Bryobacterales bacterium]|nr:PH domain-containing protein [Bryobacterales bacterium]